MFSSSLNNLRALKILFIRLLFLECIDLIIYVSNYEFVKISSPTSYFMSLTTLKQHINCINYTKNCQLK